MRTGNGDGPVVAADTVVQELLPLVVDADRMVRVVDGDTVVGVVDRRAVMSSLVEAGLMAGHGADPGARGTGRSASRGRRSSPVEIGGRTPGSPVAGGRRRGHRDRDAADAGVPGDLARRRLADRLDGIQAWALANRDSAPVRVRPEPDRGRSTAVYDGLLVDLEPDDLLRRHRRRRRDLASSSLGGGRR